MLTVHYYTAISIRTADRHLYKQYFFKVVIGTLIHIVNEVYFRYQWSVNLTLKFNSVILKCRVVCTSDVISLHVKITTFSRADNSTFGKDRIIALTTTKGKVIKEKRCPFKAFLNPYIMKPFNSSK